MPREAHLWDRNAPHLWPSLVCYHDILGYSAWLRAAIAGGTTQAFLSDLVSAVSEAYERVRQDANPEWLERERFKMRALTDNIVVGFPMGDPSLEKGEPELVHTLMLFADVQASLAMNGFLARGAIAYGDFYMDDDIVLGKPLLDAYELDRKGEPPRIVLAPSAMSLVSQHLQWYSMGWAPHHSLLVQDPDGVTFLDYLYHGHFAYPDDGGFLEIFERHKEAITDGMRDYSSDRGAATKFEWAAHYHNFACIDFAERHPVRGGEEWDADAAAATQAQELRNLTNSMDQEGPDFKRLPPPSRH